jgi:ubiquinone/menaquinone biosynthesis C-methylase UbiE
MAKPFTLANQANSGFSDAANYDQHRPSYPVAAVEKLLTHLGVAGQNNGRIIDLASGTGKFTELLVARPDQYEVVAVEPHDGMRANLVSKHLGSSVKVLDGHAGSIPLEDGWGDALIAAQVSWSLEVCDICAHVLWAGVSLVCNRRVSEGDP